MTERIIKYRLVNGKGQASDYLFSDYLLARSAAKKEGSAIEALHGLGDIELVWTPDGADSWPVSYPIEVKQ